MNQVTYELVIRFHGQNPEESKQLKDAVGAWLARKGRTDVVEGVIDGVHDTLSEQEHKNATVSDDRINSAAIALYDQDQSILQKMVETLSKKFGERLAFEIYALPDEAWSQSWREEFVPWHTKRFFVVPKGFGETPTERQNEIRIDIDAREGAFGTGQHSTTRCLMNIMEEHWSAWGKPRDILDVGAGTGLLSIVALKLGAHLAVGTEIDYSLVVLAQENALRNHVRMQMRETANPWDGSTRYDLVIANILVPVLHDLMSELRECCKIGGRLLLSGFIRKEAGPIVAKAVANGFAVEFEQDEGGWAGIVLVRRH